MRNLPSLLAAVSVLATPALAQQKPDDKKAPKPIHEVKAERFKSSVELKAMFESTNLKAVSVEPEEWKTLTVKEAVPYGKQVKKGDVLISFDATDLEEKIKDLEEGRTAAKLTLQQAVDDLRNLEQTTPLSLEAARNARSEAEDALEYYEKVSLKQQRDSAKYYLKSAEFSLEYAQEELNQLEKMYKEDSITEETEEIVLKRTRRGVESAKRSLERVKISTERSLKVLIPREHEALKASTKKAVLAHELARVSIPRALELKKIEVTKAKDADRKAAESLAKLQGDLKLMQVTAPMAGYVYYGAYVDGKWATAAALAKKLVPGGAVTPKEQIMTVVDAEKLQLRAVVQENQLFLVSQGLKGQAVPVAFPGERLPAKITSLNALAQAAGGYPAEISFESGSTKVMPGMNAKVTFVAFEGSNVLTVPNKALSRDGDKTFVKVVKDGADDEQRAVKTGFTDGKKTVVTEGLKAGEKVRAD